MEAILNILFNGIGNILKTQLFNITNSAMDFVLSISNDFFHNDIISLFIDIAYYFNIVILVISLVFLFFDIVEERGKVDFAMVFSNVAKGFIFVFINKYIGLLVFELANTFAKSLNFGTLPSDFLDIIMNSNLITSLFSSLLILVIMIIAMLCFAIMTMLRCGTIFVLIMTSGFYISDIIRGETTKIGEWLRQVIGNSTTYLIQYILFYLGLLFLSSGKYISTFTLWATMFIVSKILVKFNMSTGTKSVLSGVSSTVQQGFSFAGKFIK